MDAPDVHASVSIKYPSVNALCRTGIFGCYTAISNTSNEALEMAQSARELCKEAEDDELLRAEAVSLLRMAGAQAKLMGMARGFTGGPQDLEDGLIRGIWRLVKDDDRLTCRYI